MAGFEPNVSLNDPNSASSPVAAAAAPAAAAVQSTVTPPSAAAATTPPSPVDQITQTQLAAAGPQSRENEALQKLNELQKQPVIPPNAPHAKLLSMVSALATGLSAFGTSLSTQGKEGGVKEVTQVLGEQQRQQLAQKQALFDQRNQQVQQLVTVAQTNHTQAQNIWLAAKMPLELQSDMLNVQKGQQELQTGEAEFRAGHMGLSANDFNAAMTGKGTSSAGAADLFKTNAQRELDAATKMLGPDNPDVKRLQGVVADPNAQPADLWKATQGVQAAQGLNKEAQQSQLVQGEVAQHAALGDDKIAQLNDGALDFYKNLNPGAKSLPPAWTLGPGSTPDDVKRVDGLMEKSVAAASIQQQRDLTNQQKRYNLLLEQGPQGIPADSVGADYLSRLDSIDQAQADELRGYASGRLELSPAIARTAQGQGLLKQIIRAFPNFDPTKAPAYAQMRKDFTDGKIGTGIQSYNTAINHLGDIWDNVSKSSNLDLNNPASEMNRRIAVDKQYVSGELAKAVAGGAITEGEKDSAMAALSGQLFPGVRSKKAYQDQVQETIKLLAGKLDAWKNQWTNGMPQGVDMFPIVSTEAQSTLDKIGTGGKTASSGMGVSLAAARALPGNKGKSDDAIRSDIESHGHTVLP